MDAALIVSYRGGGYAGWQRQANAVAVQQVLEDALGRVVGEPVRVVGAGRTDAGVHARGQVASLRLSREWPPKALVHGTNHHLPEDVRVLDGARAPAGFDARRHAVAKEYRYRWIRATVLSPLDGPTAVAVPAGLDLAAVRAALALLPGRHDFSAFAKTGGSHDDPHRTLHETELVESGPELLLRFVGDGFLRGMVRALVGTLLDVGLGRREPGSLGGLLAGSDRAAAGPNAPAHGLVLHRVDYREPWRPLW